MNIRPAAPGDISALAWIEQAQPRCAQWGENGWQGELKEISSHVWCACENETVVGFIALRLAAGVCEILNIGVLPAYCRRNIGTELLRQAISYVREQQGEVITLEVHAHNTAAICLYERAGFTAVGARKNFYTDGADARVMRLTL